jgi:phytoene desaturase
MQSGYFRPHNVVKNTKGLYFVGASTYPGGGIPMVTISAKASSSKNS